MCQTSIYLQRDGQETLVAESAAFLEETPEGIVIGMLFDEPKRLPAARVQRIDFLGGRVILTAPAAAGERR